MGQNRGSFFDCRPACQADEEAEVETFVVRRGHPGDAAGGGERRSLGTVSRELAVHAEQGLRNRARVFAEFVIAEITVLLHEVDFAEEPQRTLNPVRVLIDGLDRRGLQHRADDLFGTEASQRERGPRLLNGFDALARFKRGMLGGETERARRGDGRDEPFQVAAMLAEVGSQHVEQVLRIASRFLGVRQIIDRLVPRLAEHQAPDSIDDGPIEAAVVGVCDPCGQSFSLSPLVRQPLGMKRHVGGDLALGLVPLLLVRKFFSVFFCEQLEIFDRVFFSGVVLDTDC